MKRWYYSLILIFCIFIFPSLVHAECSFERGAELSRIASNVQLSYNYKLEYGLEYDVHITNLTNDVYAMDNFGNVFTGNGDITKHYSHDENVSFYSGDTIYYNIYSNDDNCKGEYLMKKYITLNDYNEYSTSPECLKYPDFKYCQKWISMAGIDTTLFQQELKKYSSSISNKSNDNFESSADVFNFINSNVIIAVSIIVLVIGVYFLRRKMVRI